MGPLGELLVGLAIAVGLVGVLLPVLPGLLLVVAAVAVWAFEEARPLGWAVLALAVLLAAGAQVAKLAVPGRRMLAAGVPRRTLLAGGLLGIAGFFVVPVVGLPLGFVLGVYGAELARLPDRRAARDSTRVAVGAVVLSVGIELAAGLLAAGAWLLAVLLG